MCHAISLDALADEMEAGRIRGRGVAITFDDGYADNLYSAKPLLAAFRVPATVFVATGQVESGREFWWDELSRILLETPVLPDEFALTIEGKESVWRVWGHSELAAEAPGWNVFLPPCNGRQVAYLEIASALRCMSYAKRESVLDQLRFRAGVQRQERRDSRVCTVAEVKELTKGGLVSVGAHTVTHQPLATLAEREQKHEIECSKGELERMIGSRVTAFAYPYGERHDYGAPARRFVADAGYRCACSNFAGHVTRDVDRFQLPRFLVRDWSGAEFARRLEAWRLGEGS
jgi:peptidoglycan/xylan/chitin deacetylase (PgdA/CDA1 family)